METLTSFDRLPLNVRLTIPKCAKDQASGKACPQKRWPVQEEEADHIPPKGQSRHQQQLLAHRLPSTGTLRVTPQGPHPAHSDPMQSQPTQMAP